MTERTSLWGLRLLAIFAAILVWFFASVGKRERLSEKLIDAAVTYNPPRGLILLDPVQSVKVRLRGPDRRIRNLAPFVVDVLVELADTDPGTVDLHLGPENVLRPEEVEVVSIEPNTLRLRVDREGQRRLPVLPRIVGEPAAGAEPHTPTVTPGIATVAGPQSLIASLASVTTSPISLDGHALSFSQTVPVVAPDPLIRVLEPTTVTVLIPMETPDAGEDAGAEPPPRPRSDRGGGRR